MKTETEIAEEHIESYLKKNSILARVFSKNNLYAIVGISLSHKASCQRFLEFLDYFHDMFLSLDFEKIEIDMPYWIKELEDKITDLENAIKKYDEAGI